MAPGAGEGRLIDAGTGWAVVAAYAAIGLMLSVLAWSDPEIRHDLRRWAAIDLALCLTVVMLAWPWLVVESIADWRRRRG